VVLIHGLGGSQDSIYLRASASHWLVAGHPVIRLNLRGAGASRPLCRFQYHAGRTDDLRDALAALLPEFDGRGFLIAGFSLGGNMLLKFAAEHAHTLPVLGVASVSAPIDLAASSRRFLEPRNRFYHQYILGGMKREVLADTHLTQEERRRVARARSIWEFDELLVAPRNGYRDAEHYYAENMARRFLDEVRVPALVIHARNDPWIPADAYTSYRWSDNPNLVPLLPENGGHVGFHADDARIPWHDRCIEAFFRDLAPR
jgi:predicted alpha/beta-fold hydrolase